MDVFLNRCHVFPRLRVKFDSAGEIAVESEFTTDSACDTEEDRCCTLFSLTRINKNSCCNNKTKS